MLITGEPNGEEHLLDVLLGAADDAPNQVIVHVRGDGTERVVTHRQLRDDASPRRSGPSGSG
ncbi:hypothetical protein [Micromonospora sp. Llam0]|uniref:hypothetical protein n=1 Tax=Micromonospora sp. Llam0 TaxID=2485143 RepID=UPI000F47CE26|nr:hypothetical protein [Micromonospora sp. Llam0]